LVIDFVASFVLVLDYASQSLQYFRACLQFSKLLEKASLHFLPGDMGMLNLKVDVPIDVISLQRSAQYVLQVCRIGNIDCAGDDFESLNVPIGVTGFLKYYVWYFWEFDLAIRGFMASNCQSNLVQS